MFYCPHTLEIMPETVTNDSLGVATVVSGSWQKVSPCRCDHNNTQDLVNDAGQVYKSSFHIVADKATGVREGDKIRCTDKLGAVVGEGVVNQLKKSNVFPLMELWV